MSDSSFWPLFLFFMLVLALRLTLELIEEHVEKLKREREEQKENERLLKEHSDSVGELNVRRKCKKNTKVKIK